MGLKNELHKKRTKVDPPTTKPPQIHSTNITPTYGIAVNILVITVAPPIRYLTPGQNIT